MAHALVINGHAGDFDEIRVSTLSGQSIRRNAGGKADADYRVFHSLDAPVCAAAVQRNLPVVGLGRWPAPGRMKDIRRIRDPRFGTQLGYDASTTRHTVGSTPVTGTEPRRRMPVPRSSTIQR